MENPTLTWAILAIVWSVALCRGAYRSGRQTGYEAGRLFERVRIAAIAKPVEVRAEPPVAVVAVPPAKQWVEVGGRRILVDAASIRET